MGDKKQPQFKQNGYCQNKHPADLHGLVDVHVIYEAGKLVEPALDIRVPLCKATLANAMQQRDLARAKEQWASQQKAALLSALEALEAELGRGAAGGGTVTQLDKLKTTITQLSALDAVKETAAELDTRIKKAFRGIHAFALEKRSQAQKNAPGSPVAPAAPQT